MQLFSGALQLKCWPGGTSVPHLSGDEATQELLLALIDRRRAELQEEVLRLGRRFYADKPRAFTDRLRECWEAWRAEAPAAAQLNAPEM